MASVLLMLCKPIVAAGKEKYKSLDIRVTTKGVLKDCYANHTLITPPETEGEEGEGEAKASDADSDEDDLQFGFVTTLFFATLNAAHIGIASRIENLSKMNQYLQRLVPGLQNYSRNNHQLSEHERRQFAASRLQFQSTTRTILLVEAVVNNPEFLSSVLSFYDFTCGYLLELFSNLPESRDIVSAIPEFVLEDIASVLIHVTGHRVRADVSDAHALELPPSMMDFLVFFIGNATVSSNPYLRSRFVEVLFRMLPEHAEQEAERMRQQQQNRGRGAGLFNTRDIATIEDPFKSARFSQSSLVPSLVKIYVDIETTGRHNQFHEKLTVRHQVLVLFKYLRTMDVYRDSLKVLQLVSVV
jgi:hypothetical protein